MHEAAGLRRHGGLTQLRGAHFPKSLEARHHRLDARVLCADALQQLAALRLVQRVEDLLAGVDPKQRRHADIDVSGEHQRAVMPQEQRAQQGRDVLPVAVGVGKDADLVVAQVRQVARGGIDADRDADVVDLLGLQHLAHVRFPGVQNLAAQRHDGLGHPVARLFRRASRRIALDQEQFAARRVLGHAVRELAGQRRTGDHALARDLLAVPQALLGIGDRELRDLLALIGVLVQPQGECILNGALHDAGRFARRQPLLGLARELRLAHLHRQHEAHAVPHVLGRELQSARH